METGNKCKESWSGHNYVQAEKGGKRCIHCGGIMPFDPHVENPITWQSDDPERRFYKPK